MPLQITCQPLTSGFQAHTCTCTQSPSRILVSALIKVASDRVHPKSGSDCHNLFPVCPDMFSIAVLLHVGHLSLCVRSLSEEQEAMSVASCMLLMTHDRQAEDSLLQ